jgi:hypothetical protein
MRTTLNIPGDLMSSLMKETGEKNKTLLIKRSLEELLSRVRRQNLKNLKGKIDLEIDLAAEREKDRT